ncbi:MAG: hypothetical protein LBL73_05340 [Synergistaceae bacterium]|jgi:hypothetical protein|nr:hypothetical protein [Synergistaceae bacterium]
MNKARREALLDVSRQIRDIAERLESLWHDEEEYLDNMPENLQGSERYEKADEAVRSIESAIDILNEAVEYIEAATE